MPSTCCAAACKLGRVEWALLGEHNQLNALAAIGAAEHVGVAPEAGLRALASSRTCAGAWNCAAKAGGVKVYDDFAHHPTAIRTTVDGLRRKVGLTARILAVFEPRSNTMKLGTMKAQLPWALEDADLAFCLQGNYGWDAAEALAPLGTAGRGGRQRRRAGADGARRRGPATTCCA
jgi:UDP-N-acetylmuramate: L-alanyl-gamma-D-glutamyl-meso-diaminopimelate ligase